MTLAAATALRAPSASAATSSIGVDVDVVSANIAAPRRTAVDTASSRRRFVVCFVVDVFLAVNADADADADAPDLARAAFNRCRFVDFDIIEMDGLNQKNRQRTGQDRTGQE